MPTLLDFRRADGIVINSVFPTPSAPSALRGEPAVEAAWPEVACDLELEFERRPMPPGTVVFTLTESVLVASVVIPRGGMSEAAWRRAADQVEDALLLYGGPLIALEASRMTAARLKALFAVDAVVIEYEAPTCESNLAA